MKKLSIFLIFSIFMIAAAESNAQSGSGKVKVLISTTMGDITVELFNETPQHRDNFIKLAESGFYDSLLFHRVINHFMIQGGDPGSKGAEPGKRLGAGEPGYTIPAEFNQKLFHKKGALAAARQGDQANPEKRSSGSQFYIVQGKVFTNPQLDTMEMKMNYGLQQNLMRKYSMEARDELTKYRQEGKQAEFERRVAEIKSKADSAYRVSPKMVIPVERRQVYTTVGGYPSLDGAYTVFGQVIAGLEVVDKIAAVQTGPGDRPVQDVIMKVKVIK